jgi:hypothetical protein
LNTGTALHVQQVKGDVLILGGGTELNRNGYQPKESNPVRSGGIVFNLPSSIFTTQDVRDVAAKALGKMKKGRCGFSDSVFSWTL